MPTDARALPLYLVCGGQNNTQNNTREQEHDAAPDVDQQEYRRDARIRPFADRDLLMSSTIAKLIAKAHGEVSTDDLRSDQSAKADVSALTTQLDLDRINLTMKHATVDEFPANAQLAALYGWQATVLLRLATAVLDADAKIDPRTAKFAPGSLHELAGAFLAAIPAVCSDARNSRTLATAGHDAVLPLRLPWPQAAQASHQHAVCERMAVETMHEQCLALLGQYESLMKPKAEWSILLRSSIDTSDRSYQQLASFSMERSAVDPLQLISYAREAIDNMHLVAQLIMAPSLSFQRMPPPVAPSAAEPAPQPRVDVSMLRDDQLPDGAIPFGPWCFTDPQRGRQMQFDQAGIAEIHSYWDADLDRSNTATIWTSLMKLELSGAISRQMSDGSSVSYALSPWAPIYTAHQPLFFAGRVIAPFQTFTVQWTEANGGALLDVVVGEFAA